LTGLKLLVGRLKKTQPDSPSYQARLEEVSTLIQETIIATRQVSHSVMPDTLVDYGLAAALQALTEQLDRAAASELTFTLSGVSFRLQPAQEIGLYRIAQEGVVNALKHSMAKHIRVVLTYGTQSVRLEISDNGKGFDDQKLVDWKQAGLENMRTRARLMKADFSLTSEQKKGTYVRVTLKLD
jgi:signal transduction histidine kinase